MKPEELHVLAQYEREQKFEDIIRICEPLTQKGRDIPALYFLFTACVFSNKHDKLNAIMTQMINSHDLTDNAKDAYSFAYLLLQMAQMGKHSCFIKMDWSSELVSCCNRAAKLVKKIGIEIRSKMLEDAANKILAHQWESRDKNGRERVYFLPDSPSVLQAEPTNHCNLKCPMCPRTTSMTRSLGFLDVSLWEEIIAGWPAGNDFQITNPFTKCPYNSPAIRKAVKLFFLGEPLLHPRLKTIIVKSREPGHYVEVQTNGVILAKPRQRRLLLEAGPSNIGISIDGYDRESYAKIREGSEWNSVMQGIKDLYHDRLKMGLEKDIKIHITAIHNDLAEKNKIKKFLDPILYCINKLNFIMLSKQYDPLFLNDKGGIVKYTKKDVVQTISKRPSCIEPLCKLNILRDGAVTPCCPDTNGKLKLGDAREGIDNIWQSPKAKALRKAHLTRDLDGYSFCKACLGWTREKMEQAVQFFP
ncbi:MAG: radical SAM protein [Gammaproteobacteria bacterium]|nr:radical SAM protein [Gammaproteobacteria bacterium]